MSDPTSPREVMIDGVRYVPAAQALVNGEALMRALAEEWWGPNPKSECYDYLRVIVTDNEPEGTPIREFVDGIAAKLAAHAEERRA